MMPWAITRRSCAERTIARSFPTTGEQCAKARHQPRRRLCGDIDVVRRRAYAGDLLPLNKESSHAAAEERPVEVPDRPPDLRSAQSLTQGVAQLAMFGGSSCDRELDVLPEEVPLYLCPHAGLRKLLERRQGGNGAVFAPSKVSGTIVRRHFVHRPQLTFMSLKQTRRSPSAASDATIFLSFLVRRASEPSWITSTASFDQSGSVSGWEPSGVSSLYVRAEGR